MKKTVAVLLTVFNRKDITLKGLSTLYAAMKPVEDKYSFDVYMTNDGCTDGTPEAVKNCFPDVHIINGDGNLYWSGGMRKAWDVAAKTHDYDYYLWFNDDAELFDNALELMFEPITDYGNNVIVSGAFIDHDGKVSYGGRDKKGNYLLPNENNKQIYLMNGNLVLITQKVYNSIGNISKHYQHSFGDWDYGIRTLRNGFSVLLSTEFVGITCRHDLEAPAYLKKKTIHDRIKSLYSPLFGFNDMFCFNCLDKGIIKASITYCAMLVYAICPRMFKCLH